MAQTLILNKPFVSVGLDTFNYTIPTGGDGLYSVVVQTTFPSAAPTGDGAGSGSGLGSGAGGGDQAGFAKGGLGLGEGGVGQGFGADVAGYPQPPAYGSNQTSGAAVTSSLVVTVKVGATTVYTNNVVTASQSAQQFKFSFAPLVATNVVSVILTSSNPNDNLLNSVQSSIALNQGL